MKTKLITAMLLTLFCLSYNANSQNKLTLKNNNFGVKPERAIKSQTYGKRSVIQKNDSIYTWYMDSYIIGWKKSKKEINIVYDANNNRIGYITQTCYNNVWVNHQKYIYTYDSNNNQTSSLTQMWNGDIWNNYSRDTSTSTYDANNNKTATITFIWNNDDELVKSSRIIYKYDSNNNLICTLYQHWDIDDWFNSHLDSANYDTHNNIIGSVEYIWQEFNWICTFKFINIYDGKNNKISELMYTSYPDLEKLEYCSNRTYTYDANNNLFCVIEQNWNVDDWVNSQKEYYTYDANNNQTAYLHQNWQDNTWKNVAKGTFTYDANNFIKSETLKFIDSTGIGVFSGDSTYYYFHSNGINYFKVQDASISIYPNPNTGKFTINRNNAISSIEVYNLTGELLYSDYNLIRQPLVDIDLSDLQKGIYFARIQNGKQVVTEKIIIQ